MFLFLFLLVLKDGDGFGRGAVDAPVRVAVFVADGDAETAVIGPDHRDDWVRVAAVYRQIFAFATIRGSVLDAIVGFGPCKIRNG